MQEDIKIHKIPSQTSLEIWCSGPTHNPEPLPTFFYFALSGEHSLVLDPFNQPVHFLKDSGIRIISFTLPFHEGKLTNTEAIEQWSLELLRGNNFLTPFLYALKQNIQDLIDGGYVNPQKMAVGGLSRGGFIATHLAALEPRISSILGFAPLTQIGWRNHEDSSAVKQYDLHLITEKLVGRSLRYYIGNRDLRVGTTACFEFITKLAETSYLNGFRSPPVELMITPSIGHKGHGTSPHIFQEGSKWLRERLIT